MTQPETLEVKTEALGAVSSSRLVGRCVEVGDDDDGQPRLIIHTTREQLMRFGRNLAFADVEVTLHPANSESSHERSADDKR